MDSLPTELPGKHSEREPVTINEGSDFEKVDEDVTEEVICPKIFTLKELSEIFHDILGKKKKKKKEKENVRCISKNKNYYNSPCCLKDTLLSIINLHNEKKREA